MTIWKSIEGPSQPPGHVRRKPCRENPRDHIQRMISAQNQHDHCFTKSNAHRSCVDPPWGQMTQLDSPRNRQSSMPGKEKIIAHSTDQQNGKKTRVAPDHARSWWQGAAQLANLAQGEDRKHGWKRSKGRAEHGDGDQSWSHDVDEKQTRNEGVVRCCDVRWEKRCHLAVMRWAPSPMSSPPSLVRAMSFRVQNQTTRAAAMTPERRMMAFIALRFRWGGCGGVLWMIPITTPSAAGFES